MMPFTPSTYNTYDFANRRHIGPSPGEMAEMLTVVGAADLDALIAETVPAAIRQAAPLTWAPLTEHHLLERMREVAAMNTVMTSLIGQGYYGTVTPPAIQRNILENPAWYTAYTPYQPEIAQGRLEALLNYQTMVADLTGLPVANASLLDEATAAAEAMTMAQRVAKSKAQGFFVDRNCHPQTIAVVQTRAAPLGIVVTVGDPAEMDPAAVFGGLFQYPGTYGHVVDYTGDIARLHGANACSGHRGDGPAGADAAQGTGRDGGRYRRRLVAAFWRADGLWRPACRLHGLQGRLQTLDARPDRRRVGGCAGQQGLPAVAANPRAAYPPRKGDVQRLHGAGFARRHGLVLCGDARARGACGLLPRGCISAPSVWPRRLRAAGAKLSSPKAFFDTITVEVGVGQAGILAAARAEGINLRKIGTDRVGISLDETTDEKVLLRVLRAFGIDIAPPHRESLGVPEAMLRTSEYLTHPVFHMNRAESRDDALHAPPVGPGSGARPGDDPAWVLHDEAQCRRRDDADHMARVRRAASLCAAGSGRRIYPCDQGLVGQALRDHRL
jgi:glycine dehydrogenase